MTQVTHTPGNSYRLNGLGQRVTKMGSLVPSGTNRYIFDEAVWRWDSDPFGVGAPDENPSGLGVFEFNSC